MGGNGDRRGGGDEGAPLGDALAVEDRYQFVLAGGKWFAGDVGGGVVGPSGGAPAEKYAGRELQRFRALQTRRAEAESSDVADIVTYD